jgi:hypothetical protein
MQTYTVFKRSATDFQSFAKARKIIQRRGLSVEDARKMCNDFNDNRTAAQIRTGTKLEFERE